jgi:uncharacterized phage protein (TIGR01671 family)
MREVKYRGWGKHEKRWIFGDLLHTDKDDGRAIQFYDEEDGWMCDNVNEKTVGQFTGMYCEGREIYEGDIIHCAIGHSPNIYEITGVVEYRTCAFVLHYKRYNQDAYIWLDALIGADVIGNVYDNPEMLKGDSK